MGRCVAMKKEITGTIVESSLSMPKWSNVPLVTMDIDGSKHDFVKISNIPASLEMLSTTSDYPVGKKIKIIIEISE